VKLGFVVDGQSEYRSLGQLFPQLSELTGNVFLRVLKADLQPNAPFGAMARACKPRLVELEWRKADRILILVDREKRDECPGELAEGLQSAAQKHVGIEVAAVVKNRCFENWLIADIDALVAQPGRFKVTAGAKRLVVPNKADSVDGLAFLKKVVKDDDYQKVGDSQRILAAADVGRCALQSRSFRRFLRLVGAPDYRTQSLNPSMRG
jgi:hypothetical protein